VSHGSDLESSACRVCEGGKCRGCKQLLRSFRLAVRRGMVQSGFAREMKVVGPVVSGERIIEGGLPPDKGAESLLMSTSRAVQAERPRERGGK
jgi:hypothetical protein